MIIAIVGKTSSGKDTAAKYLHNNYGLDMVVSHTTRPKRAYETNGKEHWFDTKDEFNQFLENNKVLAYTINDKTKIEYATALSKDELDKDMIYLINPEGIEWMENHVPDIKLYSIYIDLNEDEIINRGLKRGDNEEVLKTRLNSEKAEFDKFKDDEKYDFIIYNDTLNNLHNSLDNAMNYILNEKNYGLSNNEDEMER